MSKVTDAQPGNSTCGASGPSSTTFPVWPDPRMISLLFSEKPVGMRMFTPGGYAGRFLRIPLPVELSHAEPPRLSHVLALPRVVVPGDLRQTLDGKRSRAPDVHLAHHVTSRPAVDDPFVDKTIVPLPSKSKGAVLNFLSRHGSASSLLSTGH